MSDSCCRMCASPLPAKSLLHFNNMPAAAQFLPDAQTLAQDKGIELAVFQCASCGLVQTGNPPVAYYKEVVRAAAFSEEMRAFRREQFAAFVQKHVLHGKKLLEVGCGRGEYLSLLQEAGTEAYGTEYAEPSVQHCLEQGLRVSRDFVDSPDHALAHAPFDAFAVLNFLEHWPDPNASLRGIAHNLEDGAIGLVEVPNFDMILQKNLFTEFISDHLCYFTRETLETLLRLNGFEVLECTAIWHGYILSAVVRKRRTCDVSAFASSRQKLKNEIDGFVARHQESGVAIWGAGHQALASIALLGLAGEIRYVIDSAPFKQNKFTPASHIPIVAPERLRSDPVGAIIVMAASYSDEVARIIRRDWGDSIRIAILRDFGLENI
ncbi:MAG TPA: methyltransferase domain-containing protein [Sideroxyarcus sp.]|nr:methyltransferase domain-containing protein [Sideroxyarcus sp.]